MRRFLIKFCVFAIGAFVMLNLAAPLIPPTGPRVVWDALDRSSVRSSNHILILGDSVGWQIFNPSHEARDAMHLTTNLGVNMAGHYILAARVIESGTPLREIYLCCIPPAFENNLDQHFTFNAFVKPFYRRENRHFFSPLLYQRLSRQPYWLTALPVVRNTWLADGIDYGSDANRPTPPEISPLSLEYLQKLRDLARSRHIGFHLIAPPINVKYKDDYSRMRRQVHDAGLDAAFGRYFEDLEIIDAAYFRDEYHLREEFVPRFAAERWRHASLEPEVETNAD